MQGAPAYHDQQPHLQPPAFTEMRGQERPYGLVLLFYIITLGIYGLYWHYKTHDELCQQVGRENKDKVLWFAYIGVHVLVLVLAIVFITMLFAAAFDAAVAGTEPTTEQVIGIVTGAIGLLVAFLVAAVAGLVLYIVYVLRQFSLLAQVHQRTGAAMRISAGAFMALYIGAELIDLIGWAVPVLFFGFIASLAMQIIAYYLLQENYNGIWRAIKQGHHVPTDAEAATGGGRPPASGSTSWDAPLSAGPPTASPAMATGSGTTMTPRPAAQGPTGYSVREQRSPGAPMGRLVHQSFECPRCRSHIAASGAPGARVELRCTNCQESGTVTMPMPNV